MKIIIAGSGETGTHLAKMLSLENQDVTLMSTDKDYLAGLDSSYNLMVAVGDPTSPADLNAVGADSADLFVAVTPSQTVNMISASLARWTGAHGAIARVSENEFMDSEMNPYFSSLGIDTLVYPEALVSEEIFGFLKRNWVTSWFELHAGQLILAGVRMPDNAPIINTPFKELTLLGHDFHVSAIRRGHRLIIPRGSDQLHEGDVAYFSLRPEHADRLRELSGLGSMRIRNIMISGAGAITRMLVDKLGHSYNVTVICPDPEECRTLKTHAPHLTVVNTSVRDIQTLQNESLSQMDAFIALDPDAEANIVSCMMAREYGVNRTIAQIEDIGYMAEAERLWIDKVVNKKLITSATILRYIMGSNLRVEAMISLQNAEVAEIEIREGSRIARHKVSELNIPKEMTVGGMIRDGRGMLVDGNTELKPGDRMLVIFQAGALEKVMKFFR